MNSYFKIMAQLAKSPAFKAKPDDPSLIPRNHVVEGEKLLPTVVLWSPHTWTTYRPPHPTNEFMESNSFYFVPILGYFWSQSVLGLRQWVLVFWWVLFCFVFVAKLKSQVNPTFRNADLFRLNISGQKPFHQELLQLKATEVTFFYIFKSCASPPN